MMWWRMSERGRVRGAGMLVVVFVAAWFFSSWSPIPLERALATQVTIEDMLFDATDEYHPMPNTVFISDQVGYSFFVETALDNVAYSKTTNGGTSWGADVDMTGIMGIDRNWATVGVWYDRWTPHGTGTVIHIAAIGDVYDGITYNRLDTASDTRGASSTEVFDGTQYDPIVDGPTVITKTTTGALWAGGCGTFSGVTQCIIASSTDNGSTWAVTGSSTLIGTNDDDDSIALLPLLDGDVLLIVQDDTANNIWSVIWDFDTGIWSGSTTIGTLVDSTTYDISWSVALNRGSGDVYLAYSNAIALDSTTNDIEFYKFSNASRTWTKRTDVAINSEYYQPAIAIDQYTYDLYVVYPLGNSTSDAAADTDIFYKKSLDDGVTWGSAVQLNTVADRNQWYVRTNMLSPERLYATWFDDAADDLIGRDIDDLIPSRQRAVRLFQGYRFLLREGNRVLIQQRNEQ